MNEKKAFLKGFSYGLIFLIIFVTIYNQKLNDIYDQYRTITQINVGNSKNSVEKNAELFRFEKVKKSEIKSLKLSYIPDEYKSNDCVVYKYKKYYVFVFYNNDIVFTRYVTFKVK